MIVLYLLVLFDARKYIDFFERIKMILNEQSCIRLLQGIEVSLRSAARFWRRTSYGQVLEKIAHDLRKIIIEAIKDQKKKRQMKHLEEYKAKKKELQGKHDTSKV